MTPVRSVAEPRELGYGILPRRVRQNGVEPVRDDFSSPAASIYGVIETPVCGRSSPRAETAQRAARRRADVRAEVA